MLEALQVSKQFIDILERDYVPKYTEFIPPWLSRYGLYHDAYLEKDSYHKFNNLVFYGVNGNTTVLELARRHQIDFYVLEEYLEGFYRHGFIEKLAIEFDDNNEPT
jgi:aminopeptidase-like protein